MEIKHVEKKDRGFFSARIDKKDAGLITYVKAGDDKLIIDHTEVDEEFNGQGIGKKLVMEVVGYARDNDLRIVPLCPFAKIIFQRTPEIADVLYPTKND